MILETSQEFRKNTRGGKNILHIHWRDSPWKWVSAQGAKKLEWLGYQKVKKFSDRFSRLDTIPTCDGQKDTNIRQQRSRYAERRGGKKQNYSPKFLTLEEEI